MTLDVACLEDVQHLPCSELYVLVEEQEDVALIIQWLERPQTRQQLQHLDLSTTDNSSGVPASATARLLPPLAAAHSLRHLGLCRFSVEGLSQQLSNLTQLTSLVIEVCPNADAVKDELQSTMPWLKALVVKEGHTYDESFATYWANQAE